MRTHRHVLNGLPQATSALPDGWCTSSVADACDEITVGIVIKPARLYRTTGVRCFRSLNIRPSAINDADWVFIDEDAHAQHRKSAVRAEDVLIVRTGAPGVAAVVPQKYDGSNCIDLVIARPQPNRLLPHYLAEFLNSPIGERRVRLSQGGLAQQHLNVSALARLLIELPTMREQRAVVLIARCWQQAITRVHRLLVARRKLKRGLVQQLLTGERRFPEFRDQPWRDCRLRDVATECNEPGRGTLGRDRIMGVTKSRGIVPMEDRLIGTVDRYQVVRQNWFAYNPMRLNIGSISRWRGEAPVLVSPDYVVFRGLDGELDPGYLDQYRRAHQWQSFMRACGAGSVRVRIYFNDLGRHKMHLPLIAEQQRIAEVLGTLDHEIQLLTDLHEALKEQKKGLMQQLLTGKVRVPASMLKETAHA